MRFPGAILLERRLSRSMPAFLTQDSSLSPISSAEQQAAPREQEITSTSGSQKVNPLEGAPVEVCNESSRNLSPPEVARRADAENGCEKGSELERSCPSHGSWIVTCKRAQSHINCRFKQSQINRAFVHVTVQNGNFTNWKTVQRRFKSHFLCAYEGLCASPKIDSVFLPPAAPRRSQPFGTAGPICRTCAQEFRPSSFILPPFLFSVRN